MKNKILVTIISLIIVIGLIVMGYIGYKKYYPKEIVINSNYAVQIYTAVDTNRYNDYSMSLKDTVGGVDNSTYAYVKYENNILKYYNIEFEDDKTIDFKIKGVVSTKLSCDCNNLCKIYYLDDDSDLYELTMDNSFDTEKILNNKKLISSDISNFAIINTTNESDECNSYKVDYISSYYKNSNDVKSFNDSDSITLNVFDRSLYLSSQYLEDKQLLKDNNGNDYDAELVFLNNNVLYILSNGILYYYPDGMSKINGTIYKESKVIDVLSYDVNVIIMYEDNKETFSNIDYAYKMN